jgi:uncharacterized protein DUF2877
VPYGRRVTRTVPVVASSLVAGVLDGMASTDAVRLVEVARTRVSVHYETGRRDVPVLCVCTPDAVRLPASVLVSALPHERDDVTAGWRVVRWWHPPRPRGLMPPAVVPRSPVEGIRPDELVGRGPGLTPSGDDVLAGALVAAHAVAHPMLADWCERTRRALATRSTTAVSRGLLQHALEGWAVPPLADYLEAVCAGSTAGAARAGLLAVGHSSGAALAAGADHALATAVREVAA